MADRPLLATYRVQMNAEFTLADALRIVPYLHRLGVSHLYSSPVLKARPGSTHGYDVADPTVVNPELGTEEDRCAVANALHEAGMGTILDIVPNHMGIGPSNPYWEDVLTYGRKSRYSGWFDIDWHSEDESLRGRVLLPVLGDRFVAVIERGELKLIEQDGAFRVAYYDNTFPLDPSTTGPVREWLERGESLEGFGEGADGEQRLRELLDSQHYALVLWRRAANEINYRRFFDINELTALHMEDAPVFEATHATVLGWIAEGTLDGLRIDHIDGLRAPKRYLERLRARVNGSPVVVEKILSPGERLRESWPVEGTTGYEFLNDLEAIYLDPAGYAEIERGYRKMIGGKDATRSFHEIAREGKIKVLRESLAADVQRLARLAAPVLRADGSPEVDPAAPDAPTRARVAAVIRQLIASLSVYRTYVNDEGTTPEDRALLERAAAEAREHVEFPELLERIHRALLFDPERREPESERRAHLRFITRFQQTSGPATAKGVEDTALYRFVPLASRNEVGGEPDRPLDEAVETLHRANLERAEHWPANLLCTNTHDTKRSADVRARLDVLTEVPALWLEAVARWRKANAPLKGKVGGRRMPEPRTEYLYYQTLVGVWPSVANAAATGHVPDASQLDSLRERIRTYMEKATREAKLQTSWTDPDEEYESALAGFIDATLDEGRTEWLDDVAALVARIARPGLWTALSRLAIHMTAPGTPDLYQGDELWAFALVDPDNRRPVDYGERERMLAEVERAAEDPARLDAMLRTPEDGRIKLHCTRALLRARREHPRLFTSREYMPLRATGERADHVFVFARGADGAGAESAPRAITLAPRLLGTLGKETGDRPPIGAGTWANTRLELPREMAGGRWRCAIGGHRLDSSTAGTLELADVFARLPIALLVPA